MDWNGMGGWVFLKVDISKKTDFFIFYNTKKVVQIYNKNALLFQKLLEYIFGFVI